MKCKKCGTEIESKLLYCPNCGESIQLVPEYDVLEEELLSRVVEDKNKAKEEKFATGVYKNQEKPEKSQAPCKKEVKKKERYISKRFKLCLTLLLLFAVIITCIIAQYAGKYSYDNLMNMALEYEDEGQYAKALGYFEEAYEQKSDSLEAVYGLGRMYYRVKEYKNAVEYLNIALDLDPENKKIYSYLLESYVALKDYDSIYDLAVKAPNDEILDMISQYFVSAPTFSEEGGEYETNLTITLSANRNYQIFYTTNGKNPTTSGKLYSEPIEVKEGTTVIKAVCLNAEGDYSEVVTQTYVVTYAELDTPVVTPSGGTFTTQEDITIEVPEGCTAYYSWDGSYPVDSGIEYTGPFPIISGGSVLSVVIVDPNGNESPLFRGEYYY